MIAKFLKFLFGTANQRNLKKIQPLIEKINSLEDSVINLTEEEIKAKTNEFKSRISLGESIDNILPEAFALAREAAKRQLGQRHYDVQLIGGIVLHSGKIAEMKTGEGKTLTATLPLYLNSLSGNGAHLVTVNDYLASRDAEWMTPVYNYLGVSAGALKNSMYDRERKKIYESDIVYGTNSEFGFDYLRDNMKFNLSDYVQRDLNFAIVDEVDSILIDEARTPLIISGAADNENITMSKEANDIVKKLAEKEDYEIDEKERNAVFTNSGVDKVEKALGVDNLYSIDNIKILHYISQALKAHALFKKDVDYVVMNKEVMIVDEFTGRILPGRRYSDGLHQAIEAKENVTIQEETQTLASITLQNYFRLYKKLSGMTGTALTEAEEFHKIYNLDVVSIPTNKIIKRIDKPDFIFLTERAKFKNIVTDIKERYKKGQPVLIGTVAVETSERLSDELKKVSIPHEVLNAKQNEREAEIIAVAGDAFKITIATNMAGRGTDIKLTDDAKARGGLYILGTERHESRRIDNQLRGRSGRQGDDGESRFYISLQDSLIRRFGKDDNILKAMEWFGMKEDEIIEDETISNQIEIAQEKIEKYNFEIRKQLIEYDDVLNQQRIIIYSLRKEIISGGESFNKSVKGFFEKFIEHTVNHFTNYEKIKLDFNISKEIINKIASILKLEGDDTEKINELASIDIKSLKRNLFEFILNLYLFRTFGKDQSEEAIESTLEAQKWLVLEFLDLTWRQHIVNLENIKEGIGLRGWAQKTPLIEYKHESFELFRRMTISFIEEIVSRILYININDINTEEFKNRRRLELEEIENTLHSLLEKKEKEDAEEEKNLKNRAERRKKK